LLDEGHAQPLKGLSVRTIAGIAKQLAEKLGLLLFFWVAQRFTAAITNLFSAPALAAEVTLRRGKHFFRNL
jgi:hypothetical protein